MTATPEDSQTSSGPTSGQGLSKQNSSIRFTVGKVDAGMTILLTEDHHLIEFPSLLLPKGVSAGSVVNISVNRDLDEEHHRHEEFWALQDEILDQFGKNPPKTPTLRVKSLTQSTCILEWDSLVLNQASLRSLDVYKNGVKQGHSIANPFHTTQYKLQGLDIDQEYSFYIGVKTSAGTLRSNDVKARTHTLENLTGTNICFGVFESDYALEECKKLIVEIGGTWTEEVGIDTTHLLCHVQGGYNYEAALQQSIPIVKPEWLKACVEHKKLQAALPYYLTQPSNNGSSNQADAPTQG
ncbi:Chitin synthase, class 5 [Dissophora globulifera]|uniref:Chitin synthase, class 5 n=1 Tax=Dissophora globulifera TaxID=979702 RepID=A0A9P6RPV9_9FUNG|nr:Chitin synthase, class 5 [Dissophora globulifera]